MKSLVLVIVIASAVVASLFWLISVNQKDSKARKEAIKVTGVVTHIRCKQRLKSDKSLIKVSYQNKEYTIFFKNERDCDKYQLNQEISAYYAKSYDKMFLEK